MNQIMTGEATPLQVASFLTALRMKGETGEEITGAARVMREKAHRVNVGGKTVLDTCWHRRRSEGHLQYFHHLGVCRSPAPASTWPSMVTARCRANPAAPMCSALSVSKSTRQKNGSNSVSPPFGDRFPVRTAAP
jgi:hypothetical protein